MSFFKQFPKVQYDLNRTGVKQNMVDIFRSVRPLPSFLDNTTAYKFYEIIKDNYKPLQLSNIKNIKQESI